MSNNRFYETIVERVAKQFDGLIESCYGLRMGVGHFPASELKQQVEDAKEYYRELIAEALPAIAAMGGDDLRAENARLSKEISGLLTEREEAQEILGESKAENQKLREALGDVQSRAAYGCEENTTAASEMLAECGNIARQALAQKEV